VVVIRILRKPLVPGVAARFTSVDGIEALLRDGLGVEEAILLDVRSGLYEQDGRAAILHAAERASADEGVRANFFVFLQLLVAGLRGKRLGVAPESVRPLARDMEIVTKCLACSDCQTGSLEQGRMGTERKSDLGRTTGK